MLSSSIIRNIRFLEWGFICIHLAISLISGAQGLSLISLVVYAIFFGLSFYFPKTDSYWLPRIYLLAGLLLSISANSINVSTDFLIYLYLGKSCFILRRKEIFLVVILVGFGWTSSQLFSALNKVGDITFDVPSMLIANNVATILGTSLGVYLGGSVFIILLCFTIVSEQKSRKQAEDLLQQVETLAKELERSRIARDIHDSLGHTLTNLDIQLQLAQKLRHNDPEKAFQAIDLAQTLSSQGIEDVSHALASIRQVDFDLNQAVEQLINQLRRNTSITAKVEMALPQLPSPLRHQVYLILKECFINIQKHAQASQILLKGRVASSTLLLDLEDDGVGFVPTPSLTGFGLKGISERIQMLGGNLKIDSIVGQGTLISIQIPL